MDRFTLLALVLINRYSSGKTTTAGASSPTDQPQQAHKIFRNFSCAGKQATGHTASTSWRVSCSSLSAHQHPRLGVSLSGHTKHRD